MGGSECSTGRNPLAQLTKTFTQVDHSLQQDRIAAGKPMTAGGALRTQGDMGQLDNQVSIIPHRTSCLFTPMLLLSTG